MTSAAVIAGPRRRQRSVLPGFGLAFGIVAGARTGFASWVTGG